MKEVESDYELTVQAALFPCLAAFLISISSFFSSLSNCALSLVTSLLTFRKALSFSRICSENRLFERFVLYQVEEMNYLSLLVSSWRGNPLWIQVIWCWRLERYEYVSYLLLRVWLTFFLFYSGKWFIGGLLCCVDSSLQVSWCRPCFQRCHLKALCVVNSELPDYIVLKDEEM